MSKDKQDTQRRRTVALMHILAYFRSQKTSQLQKQSGLNAQLSGMSLTGLAAGPIIGFSANPRTILKFKNKLALAHPHYVCEQVKKAIELNCFAILLIDDYHNVHAKKVPTKLITSTATHMASC
ncbi:uncharacterized protein LOC122961725 [Acropora millepora]|nr:uncharacterized protein LOC122961725 [Acropora millepora]